EIFLTRFAHHRSRIDRITTMRHSLDMKDRILVLQRVVSVVIAEGTFRTPLFRRGMAYQSELGFRCEPVFTTNRILTNTKLLSGEQRGQQQLRNIFRQRCDGSENQGRWTTEEDCDRQRLAQGFGCSVMKASAFLNLPMQSGRLRVENV